MLYDYEFGFSFYWRSSFNSQFNFSPVSNNWVIFYSSGTFLSLRTVIVTATSWARLSSRRDITEVLNLKVDFRSWQHLEQCIVGVWEAGIGLVGGNTAARGFFWWMIWDDQGYFSVCRGTSSYQKQAESSRSKGNWKKRAPLLPDSGTWNEAPSAGILAPSLRRRVSVNPAPTLCDIYSRRRPWTHAVGR